MGVPFEAFLPYVVMFSMFGITGVGMGAVRKYRNDGKRLRWSLDRWDEQSKDVMERDRRLTGRIRGQSDNHVAPPGFELSSAWKLEKRIY